jgi:REP-associated tyrosine transposase
MTMNTVSPKQVEQSDHQIAQAPGSAPVSGVGESVPLSQASLESSAPETRYHKRRLPHFEQPWSIYAVTITTRSRRCLTPAARTIVLNSVLHFQLERYQVFAVCVMPDHVHLLVQPWAKQHGADGNPIFWKMSELTHSIKSFSAHAINKLEHVTGAVWEEESFDRYVRSERDLREKFRYICRNPWEARLVGASDDYPWLWTWQDAFHPGSTPLAGVGECVPISQAQQKVCFGETPKPTPETAVLPGSPHVNTGVPPP